MPWYTAPKRAGCDYCKGSGDEVLFNTLVPCRKGCKSIVPVSVAKFWRRLRDVIRTDVQGLTYAYKEEAAKVFNLSVEELTKRVQPLVTGQDLDITQHSYRERP